MKKFDVIVIGGGPAGYEAAAIAANSGAATLLVERDTLGGTCLNRGCIPTKSFCRSAEVALSLAEASTFGIEVDNSTMKVDMLAIVARKNAIVEQLRQGVEAVVGKAEVVHGEARFVSTKEIAVDSELFTAKKFVIATGSEAVHLPIEGTELALTSTEMLNLETIPTSVAIIGGGVIGMEFASIFAAFGSNVTVLEYCKEILSPFDKDIAKRLRTTLQKRGVAFNLSAEVTAIYESDNVKVVNFNAKGKEQAIEADVVLMAVGRKAVIPAGAEEIGITISRRGIVVDENFATNVEGVYAIGDCNGICQLAHAASAQAEAVMEHDINLSVIPSAVFTVPECAMVGLTEEQCKTQTLPYNVGKAFFRANGKAVTMGETDGIIKLIVNTENGQILGCHICGPHAADLVAEAALAMSKNIPVSTLASTIHSHPSLSETLRSAAIAAL